jgi:hypothetical protein
VAKRDGMMEIKEMPISQEFEEVLNRIKKELCEGTIKAEDDTIYYKSPFLDFSNDEIIIKIVRGSSFIKISDNNRTIMNLLSSGFDPFSTKSREYLLDSIAGSCGVEVEKYGEIYTTAQSLDEISDRIFWMIHAVQRLTSIVITGKAYKPPTFKNDVAKYLREEGVQFREDPVYRIGGKIKARIDFDSQIGNKTIICRAMSYTSTYDAVTYSEKFVHESEILKKNYVVEVFPLAIIDDSVITDEKEPVFNGDILQLLSSVKVIPWSEKESVLEIFTR